MHFFKNNYNESQPYFYFSRQLRNLIPNGNEIQVTNSNKIMYLNEMAKLRLKDDVEQEIKAFVTGLQMLIPKELLMNFNENELEVSYIHSYY
jgi:hypothetical protein